MEKTRWQVIDTNLQYRQQVQILKYLSIVFLFTLVYEIGLPLISTDEQDFSSTSIHRTKVIPLGRLENLSDEMKELVKANPQFAQDLAGKMAILDFLRLQVKGDLRSQENIDLIFDFLERVWTYVNLPTWKDKTPFKKIQKEIDTILKLMALKIENTVIIPNLNFKPSAVEDFPAPKRDIFSFARK